MTSTWAVSLFVVLAVCGFAGIAEGMDDTGACCKADQTCVENMTQAECEAISGAWWAGPGTTCDDCCWISDCPPGAHVEDEPCGENANPGCDGHPPMFESIPTGGLVCGTVWADDGSADEDWYQLVLTGNATLTIKYVETQVPIRLAPCFEFSTIGRHRPPECDQLWYDDGDVLYTPCVPQAPIQWDCARGRYWVLVRPEDRDGPITDFYPCGRANDYHFEVQVEYEPCGDICVFPGGMPPRENEPDYCYNPHPDTFNSGCDQYVAPPSSTIHISDNYTVYCAKSGWYELPSPLCAGDLNCDDAVDFGDINPFVLALSDWSAWMTQYPDCPPRNADINGDGLFGGWRGFGDINAFVDLLAGGGGQPQPCAHEAVPTPDTDWWEFEVLTAHEKARVFVYSEFPFTWEIYSQAAGCFVPPMERHRGHPCNSVSIPTRCLPKGWYWVRILPDPGVACGKEYAIGIEEFRVCQPCAEECEPTDTPENESCGEHLNDQCAVSAMTIPDPYWPNQSVICGSSYNLLLPEENDEDWYQFDVPPGDSQYLVVVLNSDMPVTPWITVDGCSGGGWLVEDGIGCDPNGELTGFYIDKQHVPGGSHVDLRITPRLWNPVDGWYANPGHSECEQTYRLIAGYSPTEPQPGDFGIGTFRRLESAGMDRSFIQRADDAEHEGYGHDK